MNGVQFNFWHIYGYDNSGRIGYDTIYYFGSLGEKPTDYLFRESRKIEYDSQNRISRIMRDDGGNNNVIMYNYDAAGNLIHPASEGVVYDNKINLNRTNDIWMFLSRDYSINNPFIAESYNAAGYPTKINTGEIIRWMGTEIKISPVELGYGCRPSYY